jgi:xanthine phosphoribosyltransferase
MRPSSGLITSLDRAMWANGATPLGEKPGRTGFTWSALTREECLFLWACLRFAKDVGGAKLDILEERIRREGLVLSSTVLKVDSFLNHQVDPQFTLLLGAAMADPFQDCGVTKVLTVEASGIHFAMATALALGVPFVYAKKKKAITQTDAVWMVPAYSYTRQETYQISVSKSYLTSEDVVLMVDDILAEGAALCALTEIVRSSGAIIAGAAVVVEKSFQAGRAKLQEAGVRVHALARIRTMSESRIEFIQESRPEGAARR